MITEVKGNIFDYIADNCLLLHQVNCRGVMGAGLAKQIRSAFPEVYNSYMAACRLLPDGSALGQVDYTSAYYNKKRVLVCSCFGQDRYGRDKQYTDYNALRQCFKTIAQESKPSETILIPKYIGCGLAGGDWNTVKNIIQEELNDFNVTLVEYNK